MINSQPPRLRLSLRLQSAPLDSQQVLLPTYHAAVAKHLGCSQTRPLVTHYLDIRRQTARRYANVDAIRLRKHLRGRHTNPPPPLLPPSLPTSFNLSLSPSIITMSPPPPLGNFPFGELTGKRALQRVSRRSTLSLSWRWL